MTKCIPNVYGKTTDRKLIDAIEQARGQNENGSLQSWWICGSCFCTKFDNGYYHVYCSEKSALYGKVLHEYRINRDGKMVDADKYYSVPTKEDLIEWCAEREIDIEKRLSK